MSSSAAAAVRKRRGSLTALPKSKLGSERASLPSVSRKKARWRRSCSPTRSANSRVSPLSPARFSASA